MLCQLEKPTLVINNYKHTFHKTLSGKEIADSLRRMSSGVFQEHFYNPLIRCSPGMLWTRNVF